MFGKKVYILKNIKDKFGFIIFNEWWELMVLFCFFSMSSCKVRKIIYRHLVVYSKVYSLLFTCEKQMVVQLNFVVGSILEARLSLTDG